MESKAVITPKPWGDFAAGERTESVKPEDVRRHGDFAAGERTKPAPPGGTYGDFAKGARTKPLEPDEETPGSFADTEAEPHRETDAGG
jgi:hypothetical protein